LAVIFAHTLHRSRTFGLADISLVLLATLLACLLLLHLEHQRTRLHRFIRALRRAFGTERLVALQPTRRIEPILALLFALGTLGLRAHIAAHFLRVRATVDLAILQRLGTTVVDTACTTSIFAVVATLALQSRRHHILARLAWSCCALLFALFARLLPTHCATLLFERVLAFLVAHLLHVCLAGIFAHLLGLH
jgi:hypothetical protein